MPVADNGSACSSTLSYGYSGETYECPGYTAGDLTTLGSNVMRSAVGESQPAATPWDNGRAVPGARVPSSIWQNQVASAPAPASLVGLPAVPRNGVASLPPLPGLNIMEDIFAPDVMQRDDTYRMSSIGGNADDGNSSTDDEDELGRAVMSAMSAYRGSEDEVPIFCN